MSLKEYALRPIPVTAIQLTEKTLPDISRNPHIQVSVVHAPMGELNYITILTNKGPKLVEYAEYIVLDSNEKIVDVCNEAMFNQRYMPR